MAMADWIDKYPHVKALLQRNGEPLRYTPDGASSPPVGREREVPNMAEHAEFLTRWRQGSRRPSRDMPEDVEEAEAYQGPSPLIERFFPPVDLSPMLPLTAAMVADAWGSVARLRLPRSRALCDRASTLSGVP
jgi:hypothetical protein